MKNGFYTSNIAQEVRVFNKKNSIIVSAAELTIVEQNIYSLIQYIVIKAYKKSYSTQCIIPLVAFKDYFGSKIRNSKSEIEDIFESLNQKTIRMNILNEEGDRRVGVKSVSLIDGFYIPDDPHGNIVIDVPQYLLDMIRDDNILDYTPSLLQVARQSKKKYTPRLYDFFYRYATAASYINVPKMSIENFRNICGVKETDYKRMTDFKKKVLEETKKELAESFDLEFSYDFHKEGRQVASISFEFTKEQRAKAVKYMKEEKKKAISVEDDVFVIYAREHAERENLVKFNEIVRSPLIDKVVSAGKNLHYKIMLTNGKNVYAVFEEIKDLINYIQYLARKKAHLNTTNYRAYKEVPELYELMRYEPMHEDAFDPSIVRPTNIQVSACALCGAAHWKLG